MPTKSLKRRFKDDCGQCPPDKYCSFNYAYLLSYPKKNLSLESLEIDKLMIIIRKLIKQGNVSTEEH
ncbi:hypothetical protein PCC8801_2904 [Rippkaea orientalis PCC 8801]|uniref:Uncharacterized protein n=1 Tax=Rippkaea orientalis (strain PCC 8801 / RF-1) TaxID=41431 RepID=B7JV49_RIPO1|nr:hypothetical protein PCC8801_2904 [Rippkaea orientalis PCC 8801]